MNFQISYGNTISDNTQFDLNPLNTSPARIVFAAPFSKKKTVDPSRTWGSVSPFERARLNPETSYVYFIRRVRSWDTSKRHVRRTKRDIIVLPPTTCLERRVYGRIQGALHTGRENRRRSAAKSNASIGGPVRLVKIIVFVHTRAPCTRRRRPFPSISRAQYVRCPTIHHGPRRRQPRRIYAAGPLASVLHIYKRAGRRLTCTACTRVYRRRRENYTPPESSTIKLIYPKRGFEGRERGGGVGLGGGYGRSGVRRRRER